MPELVWDTVGDRVYETGLDKGVLYLPDGSAVPWNGLTAIIETFDKETSPVYYDGMKIRDNVVLGDFAASMKAVTFPDEFLELEGLEEFKHGVYQADQMPQTFGLCYRTTIGNDVEGPEVGYKIHILYNVTAIPKDKTYATLSSEPSLVEFEWEITAVPEEVPDARPTAHIIIDTTEVDALLLAELELILYGSSSADASLIPMTELVDRIKNFLRFEIIDNGDGTWSAVTDYDDLVDVFEDDSFEIRSINASYLDEETYIVTSTTGASDVPQIGIYYAGGDVWTATSDYDALIVEGEPGLVQIHNATTTYVDAETYLISDTPEP